MSQPSPAVAPPPARSRRRSLLLSWAPTVVFSMILPFVTYSMLTSNGSSEVKALLISGLWPLAEQVIFFALHRRLDEFTLLILVFMVLGVVSFVAFNSARMILIKDSALTGLMGLVFLASLLAPRPLTFYFGRKFGTDGSKEAVAEWNGLWRLAGFRHTQRVIGVVWGLAFLAEAGLRIALAFMLSTQAMVAVNSVLPLALIAGVIGWTITYAKRARARGEARAAAVAAGTQVPA